MEDAERRFAERLGDSQLVHLFIVALLQVDDLALGRATDQDHRKTVGRGVGQRRQAIEKAGSRHGQADAGFFGQEAGDCRGVAGVLFVPEREDAQACSLRHAAQVGDRNSRHAVDRVDAIELERVDNEVESIRQFLLCFDCIPIDAGGLAFPSYRCISHGILRMTHHQARPGAFGNSLFHSSPCQFAVALRHVRKHVRKTRDAALGAGRAACFASNFLFRPGTLVL